MTYAHLRDHVVAVIPAYRAPRDFAERVTAVAAQVSHVVVVDDGSDSVSQADFRDPRVQVVPLAENAGIAHALNVGVARARELGALAILTLDQDSTPPPDYVRRILDTAESGTEERVGAWVPGQVGGTPILRAKDPRYAFDPIQAGWVLPLETLDTVGEFDESLFIDAVDSEFTVRARAQGYEFVIVDSAALGHELGTAVPLTFFGHPIRLGGKTRHVLYHAPFRTYYLVRNSIRLGRRYGRTNRSWTRRRTLKNAEMVIGCLLTAPDRGRQLKAVWWGLRHGLSDVGGRIPAGLARSLAGKVSV